MVVLFWFVILMFAVASQVIIFYYCYQTLMYNQLWITKLNDIETAYQCTYSSLFINLLYLQAEMDKGSYTFTIGV